MQYFYKTSIKYKVITFSYGIIFWGVFNFLTGSITGDKSFSDNYFVLFIALSYAAFLSSYKMKFDNGHIFTYQFGMVTNNINLFKSDKVLEEGKRLVIYYPDDSRFPIKISRFDDAAINIIQESVKPHSGERVIDDSVETDISKVQKSDKLKSNSTLSIFLGVISLGIAIIAFFTDVIYFPIRNGSGFETRLSDSTYEFYILLGFIIFGCAVSLIKGILIKLKE